MACNGGARNIPNSIDRSSWPCVLLYFFWTADDHGVLIYIEIGDGTILPGHNHGPEPNLVSESNYMCVNNMYEGELMARKI